MKTKKSTKAEMRVAIAKDALKQIELEKYIPTCGAYIDYRLREKIKNRPSDQAQETIFSFQEENTCNMCIKGALLLSAIRKYNKLTNYEVNSEWQDKLDEYFPAKQLDSMEYIFEGWWDEKRPKQNKFIEKYEDETQRSKAILRNIIRNKGTFKL